MRWTARGCCPCCLSLCAAPRRISSESGAAHASMRPMPPCVHACEGEGVEGVGPSNPQACQCSGCHPQRSCKHWTLLASQRRGLGARVTLTGTLTLPDFACLAGRLWQRHACSPSLRSTAPRSVPLFLSWLYCCVLVFVTFPSCLAHCVGLLHGPVGLLHGPIITCLWAVHHRP